MTTEIVARRLIAAVLVEHDRRFLFIRQDKPGGAFPGTLHIPGGGLEDGEDPKTAARRELLEEVGLSVGELRPAGFDWETVPYKGRPTQLLFLRFTATTDSDQVHVGSDAVDAVWIPAEDLPGMSHNPATTRFLTALNLI